MRLKSPLHLSLTPYQQQKGKPRTRALSKRGHDPDSIDLSKVDLKGLAKRSLKVPASESYIDQLGEPFEYHGKPTRAYDLQAIAKLLRRDYFQLYNLYKRERLPQPAVLYIPKGRTRQVPFWITPQVRAIVRMFNRIHAELISKGYRDVITDVIRDELAKDADEGIARLLGTERQQERDEFTKIAGPYGVIWIER